MFSQNNNKKGGGELDVPLVKTKPKTCRNSAKKHDYSTEISHGSW